MWATIGAINGHADFKTKFPMDDAAALPDLEAEFAKALQCRCGSWSWRGQVAAVNGVDIAMRNPGKAVSNSRRYFKSSQVNTLSKAKSKTRSKQNKDTHKFSSVYSERGMPLPVLTSGGE
jgi:hypothetical protein